jgi:hypothetical protein
MDQSQTLEQLGVADWNTIAIGPDRDIAGAPETMLRWKQTAESSFDFCAVDWCRSNYDGSDARYEVLFRGVAYFDGVRHLYFGDEETDNLGYHYYPELRTLSEALLAVDKLQLEMLPYVAEQRAGKP